MFVFQKQMVTYEYFMDYMQDWEIPLLAENFNHALKDEWEMTRWSVYATLRPYLKKQDSEKSPQELFPMPYDNDSYKEEEHHYEMTNEHLRRVQASAKRLEQRLKNKKKNHNGKEHS